MRLSSKPEIPIAVPGVILALMVTGGLWWAQSPLKSPRAARDTQKNAPEALLGDQTTDSRLWEDPFDALDRPGKEVVPARHTFAAMAGQVHRKLAVSGSVCVLAVMVDGDPYAEDTESRLRSRRAVVAALARGGYTPSDAHHLGYVDVPWAPGDKLLVPDGDEDGMLPLLSEERGGSDPNNSGSLRIPFEWFRALPAVASAAVRPVNTNTARNVLVWWLRDDAFHDYPLLRVAQLAESLRRNAGATGSSPSGQLSFRLLGPRTSGCLLEMLRDFTRIGTAKFEAGPDGAAATPKEVLCQVPIFSPWATATEGVLAVELEHPLNPGQSEAGWVQRAFADKGIQFHNLAVRDDALSRAVIRELELRGLKDVTRTNPATAIVLLTEFDSLYGRALPRTFATQLAWTRGQVPVTNAHRYLSQIYEPAVGTNRAAWPANVFVFGYLAGLDGEQPSSDSRSSSGSGGGGTESLREKAKRLERAEGRGQLDAIRRLADELRQLDRRLELEQGGGIGAIGLLGSDVPDKLVALQALRPEFPNALFFTTDLDARLFHPAELRWSRNLIIASGYDLRLREDWTRGLAPFREAYQTAQFVACLAALGHTGLLQSAPPGPLVFEVGNNGPVLLPQTLASSPLHPEPMARRDAWQTMGVPLMVVLVLGMVLLAVFPALPQRLCSHCGDLRLTLLRERHGDLFARLMVAAAAALAVMPLFYAGWIRWHSESPTGEVFAWLDGVSVWPTEILRLLVVYLCLYFCLRTRARLRENKLALCEEFALPGRVRDRQAVRDWWARKLPVVEAVARQGAAAGRWQDRWWLKFPGWLKYRSGIGIGRLGLALLPPGTPPNPDRKARHLWEDYNAMGYSLNRLYRFVPIVVLYVIAAVLIFLAFDFPFVPFRGNKLEKLVSDTAPLVLSVTAQLMLIFFVLDATMLCRRMIQVVVAPHVGWPRTTYQAFARRLNLGNPRHFEPWLDAQFIARRTGVIMPLIYYPFVVVAIMIVSRLDVFDRWDWPPSLIIVTGLNAVFALIAAFSLRQAAERARKSVLATLRRKQFRLLGQPNQSAVAKQVEALTKEVEGLREGAFAPLAEQPLIRALLLPFGGAGFVALVEALAYM